MSLLYPALTQLYVQGENQIPCMTLQGYVQFFFSFNKRRVTQVGRCNANKARRGSKLA